MSLRAMLVFAAVMSGIHGGRVSLRDRVGVRDVDEREVPGLRADVTAGVLQPEEKQQLLDQHNLLRTTVAVGKEAGEPSATNMNQLFWDDGLAQIASAWVEKCQWEHNPSRDDELDLYKVSFEFDDEANDVGENAYFTTGKDAALIDRLVAGVNSWYDEVQFYDFDENACKDDEMCGHYTQTVWAKTRYVGCGYAQCDDKLMMFCNYFPSGNVAGKQPYEAGAAASNCPADRTPSPDTGLCGGCQSSYGGFCEDSSESCVALAAYCEYGGGECNLANSYSLCQSCRSTCNTCVNAGILTDPDYQECSDSLGNSRMASVHVGDRGRAGIVEEMEDSWVEWALVVAAVASLAGVAIGCARKGARKDLLTGSDQSRGNRYGTI